MKMSKFGNLFIISAPSGTGKTTLLKEVQLRLPEIRFSVSFTTREPRKGEMHGRDYFFISKDEFLRGIKEGRFLEWACVHGNYYGTDKAVIEEWLSNGLEVILDIDVQGARTIKCQYPFASTIFILPPSWEELERRLRSRGTDSDEVIRRRLSNASKEISEAFWYDYIVINDEISKAVDELITIITSFRYRAKNRFNVLKNFVL